MEEYEHLRQRFIRGEINVDEYERRLRALRRPLTQDDLERIETARSRPAVGAFAVTPRRGAAAAPTSLPFAARKRRVRWYVPILGGCLMTVAALCAVGAAVVGIVGAFHDHDADDGNADDRYMVEEFAANPSTRGIEVAGQPIVRIRSDHRNVSVAAGSPGLVSLTAQDGDGEFWATSFSTEQNHDTITIEARGDSDSSNRRSGDIAVTVPPESPLDIEATSGNVEVRGVQGEIVTDVDRGNIVIDAATLAGDSSLTADHGNLDLEADLERGTDLSIQMSNGDARLAFHRDTNAHLDAALHSGSIEAGGFPIDVDDDPDDAGATASGDLTANPTSDIEVEIDHGNLRLSSRR